MPASRPPPGLTLLYNAEDAILNAVQRDLEVQKVQVLEVPKVL